MIRRVLIMGILAYKKVLSPVLGRACRYEPTCSTYGLIAIERHGALRGAAMTVARIGRCQPFAAGGCDPVP